MLTDDVIASTNARDDKENVKIEVGYLSIENVW